MRRRAKKKKHVELQYIAAAHERAGDLAQEHHLYDDAAERYQQALAVEPVGQEASLRIVNKLGAALSFGTNPKSAKPWLEKTLAAYSHSPASSVKTVNTLISIAHLSWLEGDMIKAVALVKKAVKIAKESGDKQLQSLANIRMAGRLHLRGYLNEARKLLEIVGDPECLDETSSRALFYTIQGTLFASQGKAQATYRNFERAAALLDEHGSLSQIVSFWNDYACATTNLGDIRKAKACFEKALVIVRRNNAGWRIPYFAVNYADCLFRFGRYDEALEYMHQALYSDAEAPVMEYAFAAMGIPIGLHFKDEKILARCSDPAVLEMVFRSGHVLYSILVASAFAHLYASRDRDREAQEVLHTGLEVVRQECVAEALDFPLAVAQHGALSDVFRARTLLEYRTKLPHPALARAYLALFDAYVEQRLQRTTSSYKYATDAARRFEALELHRYADSARAIVPSLRGEVQTRQSSSERPFATLASALTEREHQVAELVIRGYTNRQIAAELNISKHTVESHVRSVMSRLGIRSRHQVGDILPEHLP